MPLSRKVQLAVSAYVRHKHTDYDKLLKQVSWQEARARVEPVTLRRLQIWRGEDSDDAELENVLREIIVIDSDDDEAPEGSLQDSDEDYDAESVEFVASNARVNDRYIDPEYSPMPADHHRTYLAPQRRRQEQPLHQPKYIQHHVASSAASQHRPEYVQVRSANQRLGEPAYASSSRHPFDVPPDIRQVARIHDGRGEAHAPREAS